MPLDRYVTLGRSGLRVSPLCLGTMTFGEEWGWGASIEDSRAILDAYEAAGGNFLDTANIYTKGHSETIIGDWLHAGDRGRRDRTVIATKFMGNLHRGDPNSGGAGRKAIVNACEHSLRRLRTDHIDLYWAHFHDRATPIEEMMRTLDDLVRSGKVRHVGLSDHPAWVCASAIEVARREGWEAPIALQIEYSLLQRTVEGELMPMARHYGLGVTPWSPLRAGILTGKYRRDARPAPGTTRVPEDSRFLTEATYDLIDELVAIADALGTTPARVALAWVQGRDGVSSTIIGARTLGQLEDNLGALEVTLAPEQVAALDAKSVPALPFPCEFLDGVRVAIQHGAVVNGQEADPWPLGPAGPHEVW